ncbi:xanthine dehydrogenase family protein molybdopterin-binding subunit [uncultured Roseibium sp.]|uniref:xanthine dehydrogenase family protein molybdopterin-binding subunit n=1 Tax=uncultured Roseibium sp. TaxID=1936171 RepID=UPI00262619F1|nr:xanthine dehydrogenase family protein molybdopterin-binding subunit [uncultured Roseibium sp.]
MNQMVTPKFGVGAPLRRKEDEPLITGKGIYTGDYMPDGCLHGVVVRSAMAHAKIKVENADDIREMDGVHMVLTGADVAGKSLLTAAHIKQLDGTHYEAPPQPLLCEDTVRFVGDAIAFIVADDLNLAKSAAEMLEIDYEPLDVVIGIENALDPDAAKVWPELGTNVSFTLGHGDQAKTQEAFSKAHKTVSIEVVNNRIVVNYMELRGCVAEYDTPGRRFKLTLGTQGGHGVRDILCSTLGLEASEIQVITPEVGGGFGTKAFCYREYPLAMIAARSLERPVRWAGERMEHFVTDAHGRDNLTHAELALDENNRILGLNVHVKAAMGAYLNQFGPFIPYLGASMASGLYDIPAVFAKIDGVYMHTVPTDAYRGAGRPEAAYVLERLIDKAGEETGLGPIEFRKLNFIRADQLPYTTQTGRLYDTGDFAGHLDKALEVADWDGFKARQAESAQSGKYRGIGICSYVEACAFAGSEEATLELDDKGSLTLLIGTQTNGQGHDTAYSQVVAEQFGVSIEDVTLIQGDTDRVRKGGGTGGSRSIPIGLPSVRDASVSLVKKVKELAADKLEAGIEDLELESGVVRVVGTDQQVTLAEIAASTGETLSAREEVAQSENTYPNGTHICELEVDPETGDITVANYVIVDDFGVTVNPLLLTGQVHGGVVSAISQALCEHTVYDEEGQLLTASLLDYQLIRAADLPDIHFETRNIPSTTNAMGIKGAGEAGTIGGLAAVMNAIQVALKDGAGVEEVFDMPATPLRVWDAIQAAR